MPTRSSPWIEFPQGDICNPGVLEIEQSQSMEFDDLLHSIRPDTSSDSFVDPATLRDDAEEILRAAVSDMRSDQTAK